MVNSSGRCGALLLLVLALHQLRSEHLALHRQARRALHPGLAQPQVVCQDLPVLGQLLGLLPVRIRARAGGNGDAERQVPHKVAVGHLEEVANRVLRQHAFPAVALDSECRDSVLALDLENGKSSKSQNLLKIKVQIDETP